MILAEASPALGISITLLIIVHVVVSLLIILVVMMQRPKQDGLGAAFGGGMTDQLLGAGTTGFLQKATVTLGILFFCISLVLAILIGRSNKNQGLTTEKVVPSEEVAAPLVPEDVSLEENLEESDELLQALETAGGEAEEADDAEAPAAEEIETEDAPVLEEEVPAEATEEEAAPAETEEESSAADEEVSEEEASQQQ